MRLLKKWDDDLGGSVVLSLCDDFDEPCLVRKWRELENVFGTNFTGQILSECSGDATCVMLDLCKQSDSCIDHILQKHWKELHLLEIGAAELVTMLSNSQIEVLPNLKNISPADCYCAQ